MASLNELLGETPAPLSSLIADEPVGSSLPEATARNRAAIAAIQSGSPVQNFQSAMSENTEGRSDTVDELTSTISQENQESDFQVLMEVLSDPNTPTEVKPALVEQFQTSTRLTDSTYSLMDKALMEGSEGENIEQEAARISIVDSLGEYYAHKSELQGLVNQFLIDNEQSVLGTIEDFTAIMVPGTESITNFNITKTIYDLLGVEYTAGKKLRDITAPGFSALEVREKFNQLPEAEQVLVASQILEAIKHNNAIIAGDENQVRAMIMLERFLQGDYDTTDAVVDSVFNILDLIGIGALVKGGVGAIRGARTARTVGDTREAVEMPQRGSQAVPEGMSAPVSRMPEARVSARASEIESLEDEYANLLSQTQSALDPSSVRGLREELNSIVSERKSLEKASLTERTKELQSEGMRFRDARANAQKELADRLTELKGREDAIQQRLSINSQTEKAASRLTEIERKLAAARKDTATVTARLNPIADSLQYISRNSVFGVENPASAGSILSNMNPQKGRDLFKVIYESEFDDVAQAAFGMSKQDYITTQIMPQIGTESGKVRARVADVQREVEIDIPTDEGGLRFTSSEIQAQTNQVAIDFKNANGLTVHDAESAFQVTPDGGKIRVSAMYGTSEGGFLRAEDAVDQAKLALRQYGISEEDITIMRKNGAEYEPVNLEDVRGIPGDYKIQINTEIEQSLELVGDGWEAFDVKRNFADRFGMLMFKDAGSVNRMLLDAASNLHPNLSGSFSVASDVAIALEKVLLKQANKFAKAYNSLSEARKNKMWEYMLEANQKAIPHNLADLRARGFTNQEIDALTDFRNFWDMHYQLENLDVVRTLRSRGFQRLETTNGDEFYARPIPKNKNNSTVYDPSSGSIRQLTQDELDELYNTGGTVALLKSPISIDGTDAVHIMSRNNSTEYLRMIRDQDRVLNYREGYFQVNYKAPQYIREVNGDVMRAVAVRGDKLAAETEAKRLSSVTGKEYVVTGDDRDITRSFDDFWDVNQAAGRIAQRRRGERLEGADGQNIIDGKEFVENPIDSAIRSARSIAGRTISRPAIETAKARALKQYGHMLPKDQYGRPIYPKDPKNITLVGEYTTKELADARTTFEAINRFEWGYINTMDEVSKALFNTISNGIGNLNVKAGGGLQVAEGAARYLSGVRPSGVMRGVAFQAYIALSPFRNWIMQPAQVLRTIGYNPKAWLSGDMIKYGMGASNYIMGMPVSADVRQMMKALEDTGMLDAVDRSNLVRGALLQASDSSNRMMRGLSKIPEATRTIGFDFGEKLNLLGHYSAVWSKYKRAGFDMADKRVQAKIHAETRAISGEMNRAGDFAYNENFLSIPFQFAQVPHKFLLTATNRKIDRATRARMMAGDLILWGIPGTYALTEFLGKDVLPEDPELRDAIVSGFAGWSINNTLRALMDDDTNIDFSSLAPYNIGGFVELVSASMDEGIGEMLKSTPSGQMFFNGSGRLGAAFNSLFRHFSPISEGLETPETLLDTVNQFAKISSGWNNITKSWFAAKTGMAVDKYNMPVDTSVTIAEAVAMGFGFPTKDFQKHYDTIGKIIDNTEAQQKVAKDIAESILQMYASAYGGEAAVDPQYISRLSGAALSMVSDNPVLAREVYNILKMRLKDPQDATMSQLLKAIDMPTVENAEAMIRDSALQDHQKQRLLDLLAARQQILNEDE